jgi:diguanylate cyclase (GGDEF)-like protein
VSKRLAWRYCLLLAILLAPAGASLAADEDGPELRIAVADAPDKTRLADILGNRARIGFNPVLREGYAYRAVPDRTVWLRIRADLPGDGRPRFLSLPRQAIDSARLYSARDPDLLLAETGLEREHPQARWPDALLLPMPGDPSGTSTVYLAVKGRGLINLQPTLVNEEQAQQKASDARHLYLLLYGSLLVVGILAIVRRWTRGETGYRLAQACFACLFAAMVDANHLQFSVGGSPLGERPNLPVALWIFAMGMLLRATSQYAGHEKNQPDFARFLDVGAWVVAAFSLVALFAPAHMLAQLQMGGLVVLALGGMIACGSLFLDPRHWRWTPILIWLGVLLGLLALPLSYAQLMPLTPLVRRGFQLLLALLLACYLLLPWVRQMLRERAKLKRALVVEPSAEEKIAQAREWLMSSLEAGMQGAAEADMEWIAYRRLMAGLKPVLPQTAAAVIAMNYHNEDLLLVEPQPAEARFRMLLTQRASLLKNLSRSLAPQQIEIDFDGPEGPLDHVMLAVIPLPIERPGWGALVIERDKNAVYSDAELDLCAEFAALATTAADEAAEVMQQRHVSEIEPESGAHRPERVAQLLQRALEMSIQKRKPLSVLRVAIDGFDQLPAQLAPGLVRSVADTIREEIDFGETIGRRAPDEFLVLLAGRSAGEVRGLGERICSEMRRHPLPGAGGPLTVSIGAAQMQPGERGTELVLERSDRALAKARSYGGNQVQMVSGSTP